MSSQYELLKNNIFTRKSLSRKIQATTYTNLPPYVALKIYLIEQETLTCIKQGKCHWYAIWL